MSSRQPNGQWLSARIHEEPDEDAPPPGFKWNPEGTMYECLDPNCWKDDVVPHSGRRGCSRCGGGGHKRNSEKCVHANCNNVQHDTRPTKKARGRGATRKQKRKRDGSREGRKPGTRKRRQRNGSRERTTTSSSTTSSSTTPQQTLAEMQQAQFLAMKKTVEQTRDGDACPICCEPWSDNNIRRWQFAS